MQKRPSSVFGLTKEVVRLRWQKLGRSTKAAIIVGSLALGGAAAVGASCAASSCCASSCHYEQTQAAQAQEAVADDDCPFTR